MYKPQKHIYGEHEKYENLGMLKATVGMWATLVKSTDLLIVLQLVGNMEMDRKYIFKMFDQAPWNSCITLLFFGSRIESCLGSEFTRKLIPSKVMGFFS